MGQPYLTLGHELVTWLFLLAWIVVKAVL